MTDAADPSGSKSERIDRAEQLFAEARTLPGDARAAFVESACAGDDELAAELGSLLEHADDGEQFFERLARAMVLADLPPIGGGRYEILTGVAAGGMGAVYRARDNQLQRDVALKFLPVRFTATPEAAHYLLREARAAAALEHPNVCSVYEIASNEDGRPFIAMPFYEGETIKDRLIRGPIPVRDAVNIAVQIARGLAAAHAHDIVHRDVKPGNIMVTVDGTVKLLDFGIATVTDATLTRPGVPAGTIAYMSPEQAQGESVGPRSDLWSLGVVLYEMLSGVRPFRGGNDQMVVDAILHSEPEPLEQRLPALPASLIRIVNRLLRKRPQDRYNDADALLADLMSSVAPASASRLRPLRIPAALKRQGVLLPLLGSVVLLLGLTAAWWRAREPASPSLTSDSPERVLVADFVSAGSDSAFGDLVAHVLRSELARSPVLNVVGQANITETLRRMRVDPRARLAGDLAREVAMREEIKVVVDGNVRVIGPGLVVSASVIEARTGDILHGGAETASDSAGVLPAIERLAGAIRLALGESVASMAPGDTLWSFTTSSLVALEKHIAGSRAVHFGDLARAVTLLEEAVALDSAFGHAHLLLYSSLLLLGMPPGGYIPHLLRAYELRDRLTERERFAVEAHYHTSVTGDLPSALAAFQRHVEALRRYPTGEAGWYSSYGATLALAGEVVKAEQILLEARDRFPTGANQIELIRVLYGAGKRTEARRVLREAQRHFPSHPGLQSVEARMLAAEGRLEDAHALATRITAPYGLLVATEVDASRGRIEEAIGHLAGLRDRTLEGGNLASALETAAAIGKLRLVAGDTGAARDVDALLATHSVETLDELSRPYFPLALFYASAGRPQEARVWLDAFDRDVPHHFRGPYRALLHRARAAVHAAEGNLEDALDELRRAADAPAFRVGRFEDPLLSMSDHPELARVYERLGDADSAIAVYEGYLASHPLARVRSDAFELFDVLERLSRLHEERGNRKRAAELSLRIAEQWRDADPSLQSRVVTARQRASSLKTNRF